MVGRNNLLLLDEPTNNLDPASRESVADALVDWPGAIVLVSHDTEFVEQLAPDQGAADARRRGRLLQPRAGSTSSRSPDDVGRPPATGCGRSGAVDVLRWGDGVARRRPRAPAQAVAVLERRVPAASARAAARARRCAGRGRRPTPMPRRHGWSRRRFLTSAAGLVGGLVALGVERRPTGHERWASSGAAASSSVPRRSVTSPPPKRRCTVARWSTCRRHFRENVDTFGSGFPQAALRRGRPGDCFSVEQWFDLVLGGSDTAGRRDLGGAASSVRPIRCRSTRWSAAASSPPACAVTVGCSSRATPSPTSARRRPHWQRWPTSPPATTCRAWKAYTPRAHRLVPRRPRPVRARGRRRVHRDGTRRPACR